MSFSRADRALVTDWWLTVDRTLLALVLILAICGAAASLLATPQTAIHFKLEPFYFAKRHVARLCLSRLSSCSASLCSVPHNIRRLALFLFCFGMLLMVATLSAGQRNGMARLGG